MKDSLQIGSVKSRNRVFLAPMSGVTDLPFRQLAMKYGAGLVVTEMVASRELVTNSRESWARLKSARLGIHMVQLAGREAVWMAEAAKIAEAEGADIIDINMGCPAKKVTGGYSGAALMREPERAIAMIEATVKAVRIPVTLKMRLGWDDDNLNAAELARVARDRGIEMITVHGRTRAQFYKGQADWQAIARVRQAVAGLPFVANGDITTREDAELCLGVTGADAVMIGRGAQGMPWLCGEIARSSAAPTDRQLKVEIACTHYQMMIDHYGKEVGLRQARKHLGWYLETLAPSTPGALKQQIMTSNTVEATMMVFAEALQTEWPKPLAMESAA